MKVEGLQGCRIWNSSWMGLPSPTRSKTINFHEGDTAPLDDDNMMKPIRDALNQLIYEDDKQITYSETVQVGIDAPVKARTASAVLLNAFSRGVEFVYIRIDDAPHFLQLPQ